MDPNPTDVKLDMLRSKTSYWYNEMYVKMNIAFVIIRWMILKQNPTDIILVYILWLIVRWLILVKSYWHYSIYVMCSQDKGSKVKHPTDVMKCR